MAGTITNTKSFSYLPVSSLGRKGITLLAFEDALSRLLHDLPKVQAERVEISSAFRRVLARDLFAPSDFPAHDYSAMDGYALASEKLLSDGPYELPVLGESQTGHLAPTLSPASACRIFTGAQIPDGADSVIMQEDTSRVENKILFSKRPKLGAHIRRRGEDIRQGAIALRAGTRLGPGQLALAASMDASHLWVSRAPVVTIVSTGDELRYPGEPQTPSKLPESVSVAISAMARSAGAHVRVSPFAKDDKDSTVNLLADALRGTDLLITIGGVSVGDHDVVRPALESLGVSLDFWKVKIKPGKPIAVGRRGETRVIGLPGNPTSAQVTFGLFGMPLLRAMQSDLSPTPTRLRAHLVKAIDRAPGRVEFLRSMMEHQGTQLVVHALTNQASGSPTSMAMADSLVVVPADAERLEAGTEVDVIRLSDL